MISQNKTQKSEAAGPTSAWILVATHGGRETFVKDQLVKAGFEVYLPMRMVEGRRLVGRRVDLAPHAAPFFPRYLFVQVTAGVENWRRLYSTYGVAQVMHGAGDRRPLGIRDAVVRGIREQEEEGFLHLGLDGVKPCLFQPGDTVQVRDGVMSVVKAVFQETVDDRRVLVLVSIFGRDSRVIVDLAKLTRPGSSGD